MDLRVPAILAFERMWAEVGVSLRAADIRNRGTLCVLAHITHITAKHTQHTLNTHATHGNTHVTHIPTGSVCFFGKHTLKNTEQIASINDLRHGVISILQLQACLASICIERD